MTTIADLDASDDEEFWVEMQRAMRARDFDLFLSDEVVDRTYETLKVEVEVIHTQITDRTDEEWRKRAIGYKSVLIRYLGLARNRVKELNRADFPVKLQADYTVIYAAAVEMAFALKEANSPALDEIQIWDKSAREWLKSRVSRQAQRAAREEEVAA